MASSFLSNDQQNFECITIASVDFIKLPLIDILESHIKPVDLGRAIISFPALTTGKNKLRQDQLNLCFPQHHTEPKYSNFDVTLLYTLIKNLCPSLKPTRGWGTQPDNADIQIGDDIERLRLFRNNYYAHADSAAIFDTEFQDVWSQLKSIINRMQSNLGCSSVDYEQELLKIERVKYNHAHLEECKRILDGYLYLHKETDDRDRPEIFIKGEDRVICGRAAQFEANVKNADLSCWQITWELEKHTETGKQCIDTNAEKYSDSTKEILNINSVCLEDEGKYKAILSQESNGNEYKISSNSICLHVLEGARYQTEVVCHIIPHHGLQQCLLDVYLKYLIKNLKNPDETWTKEKILEHVEKAISTLEKNNEKKLLNDFLRKLRRDKHIFKTLMKCGEDFVAMLFSFNQRYNARNVLLSEGSLCVTICFVNDSNLETFMQKIANNDNKLTKELSRIILNKTLLNIFNIDPKLLWWTASTAKIYSGLHCFETVFSKPIEGCPEDFATIEKVAGSIPPDTHETDFSNWKDDDKVFVEIHSFPAMLEKVRSQAFVTFVGVQGSGKTATARHIALKLQEEGYEILQLRARDIKDIETHCNPNIPQVFVIDDMLGMFEFEMSMFKMLDKYKYRLTNPKIMKTKTLMTCREEVFRNDVVLNTFLSKKENVVFMHSPNIALTDEDKNELLNKYNLDNTESILTTKQSKMFPKLCNVFSKRKEYIKAHGKYLFPLPTPCILEELDEMKIRNKTYYASLVLLLANENKLSKEDLCNEIQFQFEEKKAKLLRACEVSLKTESSNFVFALSEMNGIYIRIQDTEFSFLNLSIFAIAAYHFGCQFPELILQYMSGHYIADYIKLGKRDNAKMTVKIKNAEDVKKVVNIHSDTTDELETVENLCIDLPESKYHLLGVRLLRDVFHGEEYVLRTDFLKHPVVLNSFIDVMARMSYAELFFVFLSGLKKTNEINLYELTHNVDKRHVSEIIRFFFDGTNAFYYNGKGVRFINFVLYFGHHQILQCIIEKMIKEKTNVDDLFRNPNTERQKRCSDKGEFTSYQILCEVEYDGTDKLIHSSDSEGDYNTTETETDLDSRSDSESRVREKSRMLSLACYSGDTTTVQIILGFLNEDNLPLSTPDNIYSKPLEIASQLGYTDIVIELAKSVGGEKNILFYSKPLVAACKEGHLHVVEELIKVGANVNQSDKNPTPLIAACHNGHLSIVKKLIRMGTDINQKVTEITPLAEACRKGNLSIIEMLIKNGADVNQKVTEITPLVAACEGGHLSIVKALIRKGANVNKRVSEITLLFAACQDGHLSIVEELVKFGADVNQKVSEKTPMIVAGENDYRIDHGVFYNAFQNQGSDIVKELYKNGASLSPKVKVITPLIVACQNGHLSVVKELIKKRANVNQKGKEITPLIAACSNGHFDIELVLIKAGAKVAMDINLYENFTDVCYKGHLKVVKELIKAGADVNQSDGYQKPLVAACIMGHLEIVEELIKNGASVNQSVGKETPLTAASGAGHFDIVQSLINAHADVNLKDSKTTPLIVACDKGHMRIVDVLLKFEANVNMKENYKTPLLAACHNGNLHIVKELIKEGADVNQSAGKETPINAACVAGNIGIVKELIHASANVNIKDSKTTPLISACNIGYWDIVEELIKGKANVNQSDQNQTPLIAACHNGHLSIVEELLKKGADVNQNVKEIIPLVVACQNGYSGIVEELVKAGAEINHSIGKEKETPLTAACRAGHLVIVKALVKAGVCVNLKSSFKTPVEIAFDSGQLNIVEELIKAGAVYESTTVNCLD